MASHEHDWTFEINELRGSIGTHLQAGEWMAIRNFGEGIGQRAETQLAALRADNEALVRAARGAWDHPHIVEFTATGWSVQHPLCCRPNLQECVVHKVLSKQAHHHSRKRGRYEVGAPGGVLIVGKRWKGQDPALAIGGALALLDKEAPRER